MTHEEKNYDAPSAMNEHSNDIVFFFKKKQKWTNCTETCCSTL